MRSGPVSVSTVLAVLPLRWLNASSGLSAPAACASQVGQHHAALAFVAPRVIKPRQHAADVRVGLVVSPYTRGCERHLGHRLEEFL